MDVASARQSILTGWRDAFAVIRPTWDLDANAAWPRIPFTPANEPYLDVVLTQVGGSNQGFGRFDVMPAVLDVNVFYPKNTADDATIMGVAVDAKAAMVAMLVLPEIFLQNIEINDFGTDERGYEQVRVRQVWSVDT